MPHVFGIEWLPKFSMAIIVSLGLVQATSMMSHLVAPVQTPKCEVTTCDDVSTLSASTASFATTFREVVSKLIEGSVAQRIALVLFAVLLGRFTRTAGSASPLQMVGVACLLGGLFCLCGRWAALSFGGEDCADDLPRSFEDMGETAHSVRGGSPYAAEFWRGAEQQEETESPLSGLAKVELTSMTEVVGEYRRELLEGM